MAEIFATILISLICISLQSVHAATFDCTDEPSVCKTKFGTQLEKDFKELHVAAIRKLSKTYIENVNIVKAELPAGNSFIKPIEDAIEEVNKSAQKLNDNLNDNNKIKEAMKEIMNGMNSLDLISSPDFIEVKNLIEKHTVKDNLLDILRKLGTDTGNLWSEMYSGLRETDLKTYPVYTEVNEYMENLSGRGARPRGATDYVMAAKILKTEFNLPYFEAIPDIYKLK